MGTGLQLYMPARRGKCFLKCVGKFKKYPTSASNLHQSFSQMSDVDKPRVDPADEVLNLSEFSFQGFWQAQTCRRLILQCPGSIGDIESDKVFKQQNGTSMSKWSEEDVLDLRKNYST